MPLTGERLGAEGGGGGVREDQVDKDPVLVLPGKWSARDRCYVYGAVDFMDQRFHVGDHVGLNAAGDRDWVCVIDVLYECPQRGVAMFKGRWFWSPDDVREFHAGQATPMRASRLEPHELICCDNRDSNPVETITKKCVILSWPNFQRVRRRVTRRTGPWRSVYYCDRMYFHQAFKFRELSPALFPGDPIPPALLAELGLPDNVHSDSAFEAELEGRTPYTIGGGPAREPVGDGEVIVIDGPTSAESINQNTVYI